MALRTLSSLTSGAISVGVVGTVGDEVKLQVPLHKGERIVLDLTPGDDDWLHVINANAVAMKHHELHGAEALHMAAQLDEDDAQRLLELNNKIRQASC